MDKTLVIKRARDAAGLSQTALAKLMEVSRGLVGQWESDPAKGIGLENAKTLARVLRIPLASLIDVDLPSDFAAGMMITDPDEISLVTLFRRMRKDQKASHLALFYSTAGEFNASHEAPRPSDRERVGSTRARQKAAHAQ